MSITQTITQTIFEKVQSLKPEQQQQVLNFVESLYLLSQQQDIQQKSPEKSPEELGWPAGFFEQTYGSCQDDPILLDDEDNFEEQEEAA